MRTSNRNYHPCANPLCRNLATGKLCMSCYGDKRRKPSNFPKYQENKGLVCSVDGCTNMARIKGMCRYHYGKNREKKRIVD